MATPTSLITSTIEFHSLYSRATRTRRPLEPEVRKNRRECVGHLLIYCIVRSLTLVSPFSSSRFVLKLHSWAIAATRIELPVMLLRAFWTFTIGGSLYGYYEVGGFQQAHLRVEFCSRYFAECVTFPSNEVETTCLAKHHINSFFTHMNSPNVRTVMGSG